MKLKLPEGKKERQQIIVFAAIVVVAALYGIYAFGYQPLREKQVMTEQRIESLEREANQAQTIIRRATGLDQQIETMTHELVTLSEEHMLHPRLGNYLLEARAIVRTHAELAGLVRVEINEVGLTGLPERGGRVQNDVQGYEVRISGRGSYDELRSWMRSLQANNPLITVSVLTISARPGHPLQHEIQMDIRWPVWVNPAMRETVRAKIGEGNAP